MSLLGIQGERETGMDVREGNVMAVQSIANIVKSSLGPQGLDKMLVDETGEVVITNDGATILKLLSIEHPAAKILGDLAQIQDKEVGDGTTSVVILSAELLRRATQLIKNKVHPTTVIAGYRQALKEAIKHIKDDLIIQIDPHDTELLKKVAETSLSSKLIGPESKFFSEIIVNAMINVKTTVGNSTKYPVKNINIIKTHGKSITESRLIDGYALESSRGGMGMPLTVKNAKIALLDMNLAKFRLPPGVSVVVQNPDNLENIRQRELDVTKERCKKIIDAGANVIICSKGIDDFALKYFVEAKCIAVRRCERSDMKRLSAATGAKILITFDDENGEEIFNKECLGEAEEVSEEAINDYNYVFFKKCKKQSAQTILLRGANYLMLDETERSVHDALCAVKRVLESNKLVVGGGCVEVSTSLYLENYARSLGSREQMAINEYAESLNIIPKQLAINAAKDATDLLTKLRYVHERYQKEKEHNEDTKKLKNTGLDLLTGKIRNNYKAGVFEPAISKVKSLKFATEAAITILRIDDLIRIEPEKNKQGK
ncbi:MAG: thermosome subunit [Clostridia bacterium]|nr:thermosome subunit [Clostridia bacterium]